MSDLEKRLNDLQNIVGKQKSECPRCHSKPVIVVRGEPEERCPLCHGSGVLFPLITVETEKGRENVRRALSGELPKPAINTEEAPE